MPLDYAAMMNTPAPATQPTTEAVDTEPPTTTVPTGKLAPKKTASAPSDNSPAIEEGGESALGEEPELEAAEPAEEEPELEAAEPAELDDEAEYLIDGEKVKGKDLKGGLLRQKDYTQKTQALAEEKKALHAERDEAVEARDEMLDWVKEFNDPQRAVFQLRRNFPETFEAIREYIVEQALEDQDLDPTTLKYKRAAEQAEIERMGRQEDEEYNRKKSEKTERFKKTAELTAQFSTWIGEAMTAAGLDPSNARQDKLVRGYIRTEFAKVKAWDKTHFQEAAKAVAETMGIKPKEEPKAKAAAKLPTVKPTGQKAPVSAPKKTKTVEKKDTGNFFEKLRRENGLA